MSTPWPPYPGPGDGGEPTPWGAQPWNPQPAPPGYQQPYPGYQQPYPGYQPEYPGYPQPYGVAPGFALPPPKRGRGPLIAVAIGVVVLLALVGAGVYYFVGFGGSGGDGSEAGSTTTTHPSAKPGATQPAPVQGGVVVGASAPHQMTVFLDFGCPPCKKFDETYGGQIKDNVVSGKLGVTYRPVAFTDQASQSGDYASRTAAAFFRVKDSGASDSVVLDFLAALMKNQPPEGQGNLDNGQIAQIAQTSGVDPAVCQQIASLTVTDTDRRRADDNLKKLVAKLGPGAGVPTVLDGVGTPIDFGSDPDWLTKLLGP